MRMVLVLLTSLRSFSSFWHGITRKRSLLVLRASVDIKSTEKSATMSRVFCTFFPQKGTQKSPADACAYSVPSNVRNGRLFAGLQANRPRFLPLLAGTSFHGSGIGPGSFAAIPSFRPGKEANTRTCEQGQTSLVRVFAENPGITPGSGFQTAAFSLVAEESTVCEKFENLKTIPPCIFANNPGAGTVRTTP